MSVRYGAVGGCCWKARVTRRRARYRRREPNAPTLTLFKLAAGAAVTVGTIRHVQLSRGRDALRQPDAIGGIAGPMARGNCQATKTRPVWTRWWLLGGC